MLKSTMISTKKEPKSEAHVSKFDWNFFGHNASSYPKSILETN